MIQWLKSLEMPLPELRWKRDHMPVAIVWVLFDSRYEKERERKRESGREKEKLEVGGRTERERQGQNKENIATPWIPVMFHWFSPAGLLVVKVPPKVYNPIRKYMLSLDRKIQAPPWGGREGSLPLSLTTDSWGGLHHVQFCGARHQELIWEGSLGGAFDRLRHPPQLSLMWMSRGCGLWCWGFHSQFV